MSELPSTEISPPYGDRYVSGLRSFIQQIEEDIYTELTELAYTILYISSQYKDIKISTEANIKNLVSFLKNDLNVLKLGSINLFFDQNISQILDLKVNRKTNENMLYSRYFLTQKGQRKTITLSMIKRLVILHINQMNDFFTKSQILSELKSVWVSNLETEEGQTTPLLLLDTDAI